MKERIKLGVNIDHIATLREARKTNEPDPLDALSIAKRARADQITLHLREDRRHMHESDVVRIIESSPLPVNIECANSKEILDFIIPLRPHRITLVPEKREEVTTEGGLLLQDSLLDTISYCYESDIEVALFIDSDMRNVEKCMQFANALNLSTKSNRAEATTACVSVAKDANIKRVEPRDSNLIPKSVPIKKGGHDCKKTLGIEIHTGKFANIFLMLNSNLSRTQHSIKELDLPRERLKGMLRAELKSIESVSLLAKNEGLSVYAGHGLNYQNVEHITKLKGIEELNIGHSIIARAILTGLESAIREMKKLLALK